MKVQDIIEKTVKQGLCIYGIKEYRAFIIKDDVWYGTGDYEDTIDIEYDRDMDTYRIWFEDFMNYGLINASGGQYETLCEAIKQVEESPGFIKWFN